MSTTLRWQDVAGQVRGPDYTDSAQMITSGIEGLGKSVQDVISAPEQQRKAQLAKELMIVDMQSKGLQAQADLGMQMGKDLEVRNDKKSAKEFGAAQSALEALTRTTIANGGTMDDVFNSEVYRNLSEGARSYGASHLSDAGYQGDQMRIRAEENRQQQANADRSYGLQLASHRESAAARREASEDRRRARAEADASKPRVWRTGNAKTDRALTELERTTGARYNEASGAAYVGMTVAEMGKNHENLEGVTSLFKSFNDARVAKGAEALPDTVLMKILDSATGASSNWATGVDDSGILSVMSAVARQFDVANKDRMYALNVTNNALNDPNYRPDQAGIDRGLNQLHNGKPPKDAAPPPRPAVPANAYTQSSPVGTGAYAPRAAPGNGAYGTPKADVPATAPVPRADRKSVSPAQQQAMRAQQPTQNALKESSETVIALSNQLKSLREQISSHNSMTSPTRISDLREVEKSVARKLEEARAKMASAQMRVDNLAPIPDEPFRPMAYGNTPVR